MEIDDATHRATSKITQEIVRERSGNVHRRSLKEWYQFIAETIVKENSNGIPRPTRRKKPGDEVRRAGTSTGGSVGEREPS